MKQVNQIYRDQQEKKRKEKKNREIEREGTESKWKGENSKRNACLINTKYKMVLYIQTN